MIHYRQVKRRQAWRKQRTCSFYYKRTAISFTIKIYAFISALFGLIIKGLSTINHALSFVIRLAGQMTTKIAWLIIAYLKKLSVIMNSCQAAKHGFNRYLSTKTRGRRNFNHKIKALSWRPQIKRANFNWRPVLGLFLLLIFVSYAVFQGSFGVNAATYSWRQSSWAGGLSADSLNHENDRTSANIYSAKSDSLFAGDQLSLDLKTITKTDTSFNDFNAASSISSLDVAGSGNEASISLAAGTKTYTDWRDLEVSSLAIATTSGDIYIENNDEIAVIAAGRNLYSIDISNPDSPTILDTISISNPPIDRSALSLAAYGGYFYLTDNNYNFYVLDASNPADLVLTNLMKHNSGNINLIIQDGYLYLFAGANLSIYNLQNPLSPQLMGSLLGYSVYGIYKNSVTTNGNYLYFYGSHSSATQVRYLYVVDVTDKASPSIVNSYNHSYDILSTANIVDDRLIYVNNMALISRKLENGGASLADPISTWGYFVSYPNTKGVKQYGDMLYSYGNYGLKLYSATLESGYTMRQATNIVGLLSDIAFAGDKMLALDRNFGLRIFQIPESYTTASILHELPRVPYINLQSMTKAIIKDDALISINRGGYLFDISNPSNLSYVKTLSLAASTIDMVRRDDVLFSVGTNNLLISDISDPYNPATLGSVNINVVASHIKRFIDISDNYAFVSGGSSLIEVYDISNLSNPSFVTSITIPNNSIFYHLLVHENTLYAAGSQYIYAIDISDINNLSVQDSIYFSASKMMAIGDELYATSYSQGGLAIINIADPADLRIINQQTNYAGSNDRAIEKVGDIFYILERGTAIYAYDLSNLRDIKLIGMASVINYPYNFVVDNNVMYLLNSELNIPMISFLLSSIAPSGSLTSQVFEAPNLSFGQISWAGDTPADTAVSIKVRSANNASMTGAADWDDCNELSAGSEISDSTCVINAQRYLQYKILLSTSDPMISPRVDSISFDYHAYESGQMISAPFDSNSDENLIAGLSWREEEEVPVGAGTSIWLRSAANSSDLSGAPWLELASSTALNLTAACTKSVDSVVCAQSVIPESMRDGAGDRWLQYRIDFQSTGHSTSWLDDFTIAYVVNAPPEISSFTAEQQGDGTVILNYSVRDQDTGEGSNTPGKVTPTFEYWDGDGWQICNTFKDDLENVSVESQEYTSYEASWIAKEDLNGHSESGFLIRLKIDDNEAANNLAYLEASPINLDLKDPIFSSFILDAREGVANNLSLSVSDDSENDILIKISNRADLGPDGINENSGKWLAYNTHFVWQIDPSQPSVYYQAKDRFSNISNGGVALSARSPVAPANILFQDISNLPSEEWREFIAWGQSSLSEAEFYSYKVFRSVDGSSFAEVSEITDKLKNFYIDYNLDKDKHYSYKVVAVDINNNVSNYSQTVSDRPDGQGGSDLAPPSISNVTVEEVGTQSALISWDTDEPADSIIDFTTNAGGDFSAATSRGLASMSDHNGGLGKHTVVLDGLSPSTTYYFQVRSRDPRGNEGVARIEPDSYSFTTAAGPVISDVIVTKLSNNQAEIAWKTDIASDSFVYYTDDLTSNNFQRTGIAGSLTDHLVNIEGLEMGRGYYFYVQSGAGEDKNVKDGQINYYYFTTGADTQAPVIYFDEESDVNIADETIIINWRSSEPASTRLLYGESTDYSESLSNNNYNTDHTYQLTNLKKGTTYYLQIHNTDENQNSAALLHIIVATTDSTDTSAPKISDISLKTVTDTSAVIAFNTNEAAMVKIDYGLTSGDLNTSTVFSAVNYSHALVLNNLKPLSTYYYQIVAKDVNENQSSSEEVEFKTLNTLTDAAAAAAREEEAKKKAGGGGVLIVDKSDRVAPVISQLSIMPTVSGFDISWSLDEEADAFIEYGPNKNYGQIVGSRERKLAHRYVIENLPANTEYFLKITSSDASGNVSLVSEERASTLNWEEGVSDLEEMETEDFSDHTELSPEEIAANDGRFASILNKTIDLIKNAAKYVSISVLENSLNEQQKMISELSSLTPAPALIDEPRVQVWEDMAVISWQTDKKTSSLLSLADSIADLKDSALIGNPNTYNTEHRVVLTGLQANSPYVYQIQGSTPVGSLLQSKHRTFTTSLKSAKVENYSVNKVDNQTASFRWLSSVPTDTSVRITPYRNNQLISAESFIVKDELVSTIHEMSVNSFQPGVFYRVELSGRDSQGNIITQIIDPFYTSDQDIPFEIEQIRVDSALSLLGGTKVQTIISWYTSRPAVSKVYYRRAGEGDAEEWQAESQLEEAYTKNHLAVINDFDPGAIYQFQVYSLDSSGNELLSKVYSTLTPRQKESVFQVILKNIEETFGWVNMMR